MFALDEAKKELKKRMLARMPEAGSFETAIAGVGIHRRDAVNKPTSCLYTPRIVYIIQGSKQSLFGHDKYKYGEDDLFIAGVDLPNVSSLLEASPRKPCMSLAIDLDKNLIGQLAVEMATPPRGNAAPDVPLAVQPIDAEMLDIFLRIERLLDRPDEIPILGSMLIREAHFRLLIGPNGNLLRSLHTLGTQKNQVAQAITWLKANFKNPFRVEDLADKVHMAPSTFHRHFKELTSLSPLQFQKRLRLHEAQRLMLAADFNVNEACEEVGYDSLPQFNREYKRLFGEPPRRNIVRWQSAATAYPALAVGE